MTMQGGRASRDQQSLLRTMRQRFAAVEEYERVDRYAQLDDLKFREGQQWEPAEEARRIAMGRPCLTINTCAQYEAQVTNEMRQNMPALTVLPVGNGADQEKARVLKGIIRHIEQASHAKQVRQSAFDSAVRIGVGYYRIVLEYDGWTSFDREPRAVGIRNPFGVYLDHAAQCPTGRDANWAFVFETQEKESFKEEWGISESDLKMWSGPGDTWVFHEQVRIAEYFDKQRQRMTLVRMHEAVPGQWGEISLLEPALLADIERLEPRHQERLQAFVAFLCTPRVEQGRYVPLVPWLQGKAHTAPHWLDGLPPSFVDVYAELVQYLVSRIKEARPTELETVHWYKTNGHTILEESIWPGKSIPVIRVVGNELVIDNQMHRSGVVRSAKDPMRMKNYWSTMVTEHIALSPVPPWLIAVGQVQNLENFWNKANREPLAWLPYNPQSINGVTVPPPQRNAYEPPIGAIMTAMASSEQDIQNSMGIYQGNVGAPSKERSGKAIDAKDRQANTGTYHYGDNLGSSMEYECEIYIQLITNPEVMTPNKVQRIIGDDGSVQQVYMTRPGQPAPPQDQLPPGIAGIYEQGVGTYDVRCELGPSYATRRQEAADNQMSLATAMPGVMGPVMHAVVRHMDWEGAEELSELIKKIPGQVLDEPGNDPAAKAAMMEQQLGQATQQLQALDALAQQMQAQLQQLAQENQQLKAGHDLKVMELQLQAQEQQADQQAKQRELALKEYEARQRVALEQDKVAAMQDGDGRRDE